MTYPMSYLKLASLPFLSIAVSWKVVAVISQLYLASSGTYFRLSNTPGRRRLSLSHTKRHVIHRKMQIHGILSLHSSRNISFKGTGCSYIRLSVKRLLYLDTLKYLLFSSPLSRERSSKITVSTTA